MMLTNEVITECGKANWSKAELMNEYLKSIRSGNDGTGENLEALCNYVRQKASIIAQNFPSFPSSLREDAAQETVARFLEHLNPECTTPVTCVSAWVNRTTKSIIRDYSKRKSTVSEISATSGDEGNSEEIFAWCNNDMRDALIVPYDLETRYCAREAVWSILQILPDQQKKVLILSLCGRYSQQEIADLMGIRRSTVAAHLRSGKENFRRKFSARYDIADFGLDPAQELTVA